MPSSERAEVVVWLVDEVSVAVLEATEPTGERVRVVAVRLDGMLNNADVADERTYVLGLDEVARLLSGLMAAGNHAFGRAAVVAAMADTLGVADDEAARAEAALTRILDESERHP
jgi:poly(3-hydroxybutyrate) depolymerase